MNETRFSRMSTGRGFIAALDQSGGSTPRALQRYGIPPSAYADEAEMFDLVHAMRRRIITSPAFTGERIVATILFEQTMERQIGGLGSAEYLWLEKAIVPIVKVDKGLAGEADGVRLMRPMPDLADLLLRARGHGVLGTKMRSWIGGADKAGVAAIVDQQMLLARRIAAAGLVPIVEPEVDIHAGDKAAAEAVLHDELGAALDRLGPEEPVMLKLTLPEVDDLYADLIAHPRVLRVAGLSGGYGRAEACERLARQHGMIASFSRALTEGLDVHQSDAEFDATLDASIAAIHAASIT